MRRLLIVDDDPAAGLAVRAFFENEWLVEEARNGFDFIDTVRQFAPDFIMLDINLPGPNGLKLLASLGAMAREIPVFLTTVRSGEEEMLKAFDLGAADYIVKPFSLKILKARIDRWFERSGKVLEIQVGNTLLKLSSGELVSEHGVCRLTQKEQLVLRCLISNDGLIISRRQLIDYAWGYAYEGTERTVDNVIAALRKKIGESAIDPEVIENHRGLGYRWNAKNISSALQP
ncbi:MAG: response regulator transcription factor [Candidatus Riflebacteria bacterium]|nr:response regulator transcription factor [Candidatus Riflebacteria bacterium]